MKRISMLVALAIVLALAVPAFAGPFSDVPATHWAYEAVNKLAGTGLITGYPDGNFSGKNAMTRYEIATVVARLLDKVDAERTLLADKVETLEDGLTAGQAEDVIAIFKSLIAKEAGKNEVVIPDSLTEGQAVEVAAIVEALAMEFKFELEAMGAKLDTLTTDVEDLKVRVAALEVIDWRGTYDVTINKTVLDPAITLDAFGNIISVATAYVDPFAMVDEDDDVVAYDAADSAINHELGLGFDVTTENLEVSFDVAAVTDDFVWVANDGLALGEIAATVIGDDFTAVLAREQLLNLAPYLFGDDEAEYNGIEVTVGDNVYALIRHFEYFVNADGDYTNAIGTLVDDPIIDPASITNKLVAKHALNLFDATLFFGIDDVVESGDFVAGLNVPYTLFDTDLNIDLAIDKTYINDDDTDYGKYFTINAKKAFAALNVEGNLTINDDEFDGILPSGVNEDGIDIAADMTLLDEMLTVNARYNGYAVTDFGFGADLVKGNLTGWFDMDLASTEAGVITDEADRTMLGAEYQTTQFGFDVTAGFNYDQFTDFDTLVGTGEFDNDGNEIMELLFDHIYVDEDDDDLDLYNRVYADFSRDLPVEGMTATANCVFGLKDDVDGKNLSVHEYAVAYENDLYTAGASLDLVAEVLTLDAGIEYSIFSANFEKDFMESDYLYVGAGVNPEAYEVLGFNIDTIAGFGYESYTEAAILDDPATPENEAVPEQAISGSNINLGIDVTKVLSEKADVAYGFVYDNREIAADDSLNGLVVKHTVGFGYELATDLNAEVNYTYLDFDSIVDAEDYTAKELTTGLSLSF
ncbi:MAG: S-layer homology domain-containing protein [Halanaerobiales bacterium]|nr:S-layer homology domain-containing protein [Halanaerobiales bacterium]